MALRLLNQISSRYVTNSIRCASSGRKLRSAASPHLSHTEEEVAAQATVTLTPTRRTHSQPTCERECFQSGVLTDFKRGECAKFQTEARLKSRKEKGKKAKSTHKHKKQDGAEEVVCSKSHSELATLDLLDSSKRMKKVLENSIPARRYSTSLELALDKRDEEEEVTARRIPKTRRQFLSLEMCNNSGSKTVAAKVSAPWKSYSESMKSNRGRKSQNIYSPSTNGGSREQYSPRRDYSSQTIDPEKLVRMDVAKTKEWTDDWHTANHSTVDDLVKKCRAYSNDFETFKDTLLKGARECSDKFTGILDANPVNSSSQNLRTYTSQCQAVEGAALKNPPLKRLMKRYDRIQGRTRSYNQTEVETIPRADDNIDVHKMKPLPVLKQQKFQPGMVKDFNTAYYRPNSSKNLDALRAKCKYF